MRLVLIAAIALLAGCPVEGEGDCEVNEDCSGGLVCARDHACVDASQVRAIQVTWTINGAAASAASCEDHDLYIEFSNGDRADSLGFSPVPCFAGQFSVDRLPRRFDQVELGFNNGFDREFASFDADGNATIDLRLL